MDHTRCPLPLRNSGTGTVRDVELTRQPYSCNQLTTSDIELAVAAAFVVYSQRLPAWLTMTWRSLVQTGGIIELTC